MIAPRSISLIQADSTFGWLMLRGRNSRSCVGSFCAKASTAASSAARHQAEFDVAGIGLDVARIGTCFTHVDLLPNQESSFGHSRLIALAPATRLT